MIFVPHPLLNASPHVLTMAVCLAVGSRPYPGYPVRQLDGHRVKEKRFHCCPQVHSTGSSPVVQSHLHEL